VAQCAAAVFLISPLFANAADTDTGRVRAQSCVACHGAGGNSTDPAIPSLAGQPEQALATALYQFREGNRKNAVMSPLAAELSNAEMNDLAAYFNSEKIAASTHQTHAENLVIGPTLAKQYNCTQCHGPALMGIQHIPRLAGQQHDYLLAQLRSFRAATRGDMDGTMTSAVSRLKDEEIVILSDYIAGLGTQ
jgi:cytochrome c553